MPVKNGIVHDLAAYDLDPDDPDAVFLFDNILGQLQPRLRQIEAIVRPGLDGEGLRSVGFRAFPTPLQTLHYVADHDAAQAAILAYSDVLDGRICKVIQNYVDWGHVRVQSIVPTPLDPVASAAGTIIANPTVLQRINWVVISTPEPAP